ncbi:RND family transporter [Halalkalibacter sp. APA_J-10(15)]|uniref:efflux RND transporter permease subunit n=1 Tax=unclassified Halalkalibacter TaxID=2893063 RepID=UPI001FF5DD5B|nr:MMPL family transporter [Halalkalibacter sp. APA_J-10(15)]MCK0471303.1 MMPL family transporter [Halalkalibacter sp. APA_J-10(15)]
MDRIADLIITYRKRIVTSFLIITLICAIAQFFVAVNYNMADYLPEDAPSTTAIDIMNEEFDGAVPNARVLINDVTIQEALVYKDHLEEINGVSDVMWLDDVIDLKIPIEIIDEDVVESYYLNERALMTLRIQEGEEVRITNEIYELIGEENAMEGEAVDTAVSQQMAGSESLYAALLLVPIIILILVVSTNSWIEPVFFLTAIGVSVLINLGTNLFIGEVSFITQSVSPILQLAVSLDYAIFLLHRFSDYRERNYEPVEAMKLAIKKAFPAISASAATTFFGFIALTFMSFEIGADLGFNLVKGIALSFISVMVFLPALTLCFYKWIDRTQHKPLIRPFRNIGSGVMKARFPVLILVLLIMVPAFLAQNNTVFTYGLGEQPESTRAGNDSREIKEAFGELTQMVLLVPSHELVREVELIQELDEIHEIKSVISYSEAVSSVIPPEYLDESITDEFFSENYSRMIINKETAAEGDLAFSIVEEVQEKAEQYYGEDVLVLGESVTLYDMKQITSKDNMIVNLLTVLAIATVLLVTFRSISFPVVLILTIQAAVWINLSVPYFSNMTLDYLGYLIVSTVQLAATVDYAILLTEGYKENRKQHSALEAIKKTLNEKTFSISISAAILSSVGFILWMTSSNPIVGSIGLLLGRGALLAFLLVVFFLPAVLVIFDKLIDKTTWRANFMKENE